MPLGWVSDMMASKFLFSHLSHQRIAKWLTTKRYYLRTWGHKLDTKTKNYRLELILERVSEQTPIIIQEVPSPSQMDDWHLYLATIRSNILTSKATLPLEVAESILATEATLPRRVAEREGTTEDIEDIQNMPL